MMKGHHVPTSKESSPDPLGGISVQQSNQLSSEEMRVFTMATLERNDRKSSHIALDPESYHLLSVMGMVDHKETLSFRKLVRMLSTSMPMSFLIPGYEKLFAYYAMVGWDVKRAPDKSADENLLQGWKNFISPLMGVALFQSRDNGMCLDDLSAPIHAVDHSIHSIFQEGPQRLLLLPKHKMEKQIGHDGWYSLVLDEVFGGKILAIQEYMRSSLCELFEARLKMTSEVKPFFRAQITLKDSDVLSCIEGLYKPPLFPAGYVVQRKVEGFHVTVATSSSELAGLDHFRAEIEKCFSGCNVISLRDSSQQ